MKCEVRSAKDGASRLSALWVRILAWLVLLFIAVAAVWVVDGHVMQRAAALAGGAR